MNFTKTIGIDVAKDKLDICLLGDRQKTKNLQVANNQQGIHKMVEKLNFYQVNDDIPIVIEATGGYHYGIMFNLMEKGYRVCLINPLLTKKYSHGSIRKTKTDKIDAQLLAEIGLKEELRPTTETSTDVLNKSKGRLLISYQQKLRAINNQLATVNNQAVQDKFTVRILKKTKKDLQNDIKTIKQAIKETGSTGSPTDKIKGVSEVNWQIIVNELGNIERFNNRRQIVAFAGLDPSIRESGSSVRGKSKISKRGSKTLRCVLYQSAWGVFMHNTKFKEFYNRKKKEGKHYFTCLTAIARKLLLMIYAILKTTNRTILPESI
ncbi:MAG: IS110 family transposase [Patescibacteria group bacterium]